MPNKTGLMPVASTLITTACTTSGTSGNLPFRVNDAGLAAGAEITLTEFLPIAAALARAYLPVGTATGDNLSCYVEANTVRGVTDPEATVEPGTFKCGVVAKFQRSDRCHQSADALGIQ